jgi:hypothetical protein
LRALDEVVMSAQVAEGGANLFLDISDRSVCVVFRPGGPRELFVGAASAIDGVQQFVHALFASAAMG